MASRGGAYTKCPDGEQDVESLMPAAWQLHQENGTRWLIFVAARCIYRRRFVTRDWAA